MRIGEVKDTLLDQSVQVLSYSGQLVSLNIHTYCARNYSIEQKIAVNVIFAAQFRIL
jgi:hypothetical protein